MNRVDDWIKTIFSELILFSSRPLPSNVMQRIQNLNIHKSSDPPYQSLDERNPNRAHLENEFLVNHFLANCGLKVGRFQEA